MRTPEEFFADQPNALEAYRLITDANIPDEAWCSYDDCKTISDEREVERRCDAHNARRRTLIRDVAAEIARRWPSAVVRNSIEWDALGYEPVLRDPALWRQLRAVFDAAREEAAALEVSA